MVAQILENSSEQCGSESVAQNSKQQGDSFEGRWDSTSLPPWLFQWKKYKGLDSGSGKVIFSYPFIRTSTCSFFMKKSSC